jgi:hypothetical protein
MLTEELLRTILDERAREIAQAQRIRSAAGYSDAGRRGRSWFRELGAVTPTFGGRPHPGRAATDSGLATESGL